MKYNPFDSKEGRKFVKMKNEQRLKLPKPRPLSEMLKIWEDLKKKQDEETTK